MENQNVSEQINKQIKSSAEHERERESRTRREYKPRNEESAQTSQKPRKCFKDGNSEMDREVDIRKVDKQQLGWTCQKERERERERERENMFNEVHQSIMKNFRLLGNP